VCIYTHIFLILLSHINNCCAETCPVYTRAGSAKGGEQHADPFVAVIQGTGNCRSLSFGSSLDPLRLTRGALRICCRRTPIPHRSTAHRCRLHRRNSPGIGSTCRHRKSSTCFARTRTRLPDREGRRIALQLSVRKSCESEEGVTLKINFVWYSSLQKQWRSLFKCPPLWNEERVPAVLAACRTSISRPLIIFYRWCPFVREWFKISRRNRAGIMPGKRGAWFRQSGPGKWHADLAFYWIWTTSGWWSRDSSHLSSRFLVPAPHRNLFSGLSFPLPPTLPPSLSIPLCRVSRRGWQRDAVEEKEWRTEWWRSMSRRETPGYHGLSSEENANTEWGRMVAKRGEVSRPYCGCSRDSGGTHSVGSNVATMMDENFSS